MKLCDTLLTVFVLKVIKLTHGHPIKNIIDY